MFTHTLLFAAALLGAPCSAPAPCADASVLSPDGGPPRINLAGKSSGDITAAQWAAIKTVDLHGCVPDARITALTICIKDCKGKDAIENGRDGVLNAAMRKMIANLPAGTAFTVRVTVMDAKGKAWEVPDARFVWKG